ncbi:MAG: MerR family transcriptional regulator [Evtepia gabavorous]
MIPQETTFTIGQFAAIHGIHKKTLMWYDQVGLLSPAFVGENGYRYYSYRQSARLETILMLRALEVSIPEIKTFLSHRSAGELRRLLTEKIAGVEGQIRRLEEIRHALVRQQASLARLETLPLTQISLVRRETCYLATVPLPGDTPRTGRLPRSSTRPRPISWATFTKGFMAPCSPWSTCGRGGSPTTPTSSWRSPPHPPDGAAPASQRAVSSGLLPGTLAGTSRQVRGHSGLCPGPRADPDRFRL